MKNLFENYLKNGLSEYDLKYLSTYQYVMLLSKGNNIKAYFANVDYNYFIEYPKSDKEYDNPLDVLKDEISRIRRGEISTSVDINSRFGVVIYLTGTWQINVDIKVAVIIQMLHAEGFINS